MFKRLVALELVLILIFAAASFAQEEDKTIIKGKVETVAEDASYIVVAGTKIATPKEFRDNAFLEVGDKVEISTEKTEAGIKAVDYNYVLDKGPEVYEGTSPLTPVTKQEETKPTDATKEATVEVKIE